MTKEPNRNELSKTRLNLLRAAYLVLVVGLGIFIWPTILDPAQALELKSGVVVSMLGAMSALALLGLRHPLAMLPILLFEIAWKTIWLVRMAAPLWLGDRLDAATTATIYECIPALLFIAIIPWGHVWRTYVAGQPGHPLGTKPGSAPILETSNV